MAVVMVLRKRSPPKHVIDIRNIDIWSTRGYLLLQRDSDRFHVTVFSGRST